MHPQPTARPTPAPSRKSTVPTASKVSSSEHCISLTLPLTPSIAPEDHQTPPSAPSMSILPVAAATPSPPPKPEEPAPKPAPAHKDAEQKDAKHKNKQADKHKTHDAAADDGTKQGKEVKQNSPPEPQPDAAHVQGGNRGPVGDTPTIFAPDA